MQRQMDKLEKDTYRVRKAEGRPKHGQTSFTVIGVGVLAWFAVMIAIALPEWRANWIGVLGYPHKRSWGLFTCSGMTSRMHHEVMSDACRFYSQLTVGGVCASPICLWYRTKCQVYMDMATYNYCTAFFLFLAVIVHTLCLVWTARLTPRMIRWAATWWVADLIIHLSVILFWWQMTDLSFASLDSESMYPNPDFSFSFYMECLAIMCLITCSFMGITLMRMWPESSSSGEDDSDEDEDSDDAKFGYGNNPMMGGPPPGYGPPGGPPGGFPGGPGGPPPGGFPGGPPPPGQFPGGPPPGQFPGGPPPGQFPGGPGGPPGQFPGGPPPGQFPGGPGGPPPGGFPGGPPPGQHPGGPPPYGPPGQYPGGPPPQQQDFGMPPPGGVAF